MKRIFLLLSAVLCLGLFAEVSVRRLRNPQQISTARRENSPGEGTLTEVCTGLLRGRALGKVVVYRGIPYAAAPGGSGRWRPPQPPAPWEGVRDATKFGPVAAQMGPQGINRLWNLQQRHVRVGAEDPLTLNVWAPRGRQGQAFPVMVFLHGGGHEHGAGSEYDGSWLAERGAVVVTLNYRLGVFGFLAHPALTKEENPPRSGNYALLDQLAALRWIKANINSFHGDPSRVTLFGQSAGAACATALMVSPLATGLFHRVILQSGADLSRRTLREAEEQGIQLAASVGCTQESDATLCLRQKTVEELLGAKRAADDNSPQLFEKLAGRKVFGPCVDGVVIPGPPLALMKADNYNRVPLLIGTNSDEGSLFLEGQNLTGNSDYKMVVHRIFGDAASKLLEMYPVQKFGTPRNALGALITDMAFVCPSRLVAREAVRNEPRVFVYEFAHTMEKGRVQRLGAFHGLELPFVFGFKSFPLLRPTPEEQALAEKVTDYWIQFARNGDPNGANLPHWPAFDLQEEKYQRLKMPISGAEGYGRHACENFRALAALSNEKNSHK